MLLKISAVKWGIDKKTLKMRKRQRIYNYACRLNCKWEYESSGAVSDKLCFSKFLDEI